jgi:hypothetical protein
VDPPPPRQTCKTRLSDAKRLGDAIRAGKGSLSDLEQHLAFINEYQYKVRDLGVIRDG